MVAAPPTSDCTGCESVRVVSEAEIRARWFAALGLCPTCDGTGGAGCRDMPCGWTPCPNCGGTGLEKTAPTSAGGEE